MMKDIQIENKKLAVVNVGKLLSGDLRKPVLDADSIICKNGIISSIQKRDHHPRTNRLTVIS